MTLRGQWLWEAMLIAVMKYDTLMKVMSLSAILYRVLISDD